MTYLPSLFNKVDKFYSYATSFIKNAEQDYFQELTDISNQVGDPGLARQLNVLAELYRYALSMGGGYATIARGIENLKELYSDGTDSDIESILNGMLRVLAKEAGGVQVLAGRDNPRFVERLVQLKTDIESRSANESEYEGYQEEMNVPGALGEGESDYSEQGLGGDTETATPAQMGETNMEDPKAKRGWHTTGPSMPYKDWKEHYANEIAAYNLQLAQAHDPEVKAALQTLVQELIPQVSEKVEEQIDLSNQSKEAPSEQVTAKLKAIRQELKALRAQVTEQKRKIRSFQLSGEQSKLTTELAEAAKKNDWKAAELLAQKIELNKLTQSSDIYKTKERNLRLRLIEGMSGGNFPSKETLEKEKAKINLARQERVSKEAYDRKITEERGKQQARLVTPEYDATRGGARVPMERLSPEKQIDLEKASFSALVYQFQIDIASATQAARQAIYRAESKGAAGKENPAYKAIVDEISEAIRKKDRQALYTAKNKLIDAVQSDMFVQKQQLKGYVEVIKLEPHFRKILEGIKTLTKSEKPSKKNPAPPQKLDDSGNLVAENFSEQDKEGFEYILNDMHRIKTLYEKYYTSTSGMKFQQDITPRFKKVISDMGRIEVHLALKLHAHRPEAKKLYPERSILLQEIADKQKEDLKLNSSHRISLFKLILAQQAAPEQEVDKAAADKLANEIFDQVYDSLRQQMFNELQSVSV